MNVETKYGNYHPQSGGQLNTTDVYAIPRTVPSQVEKVRFDSSAEGGSMLDGIQYVIIEHYEPALSTFHKAEVALQEGNLAKAAYKAAKAGGKGMFLTLGAALVGIGATLGGSLCIAGGVVGAGKGGPVGCLVGVLVGAAGGVIAGGAVGAAGGALNFIGGHKDLQECVMTGAVEGASVALLVGTVAVNVAGSMRPVYIFDRGGVREGVMFLR